MKIVYIFAFFAAIGVVLCYGRLVINWAEDDKGKITHVGKKIKIPVALEEVQKK